MKNLISLSGKIGSGKDLTAKIIQYLTLQKGYPSVTGKWTLDYFINGYPEEHTWESDWRVVKFAEKLKQIVSLLTGIPREDFEKEATKNSLLPLEWSYFVNDDIIEKYQKRFTTYEEAVEYYILEKEEIINIIRKRMTVRQLLQEIGTEGLRSVHPNIHVNALFADYKNKWDNLNLAREVNNETKGEEYPNWILSDMRFPNELEAIKKHGGITIRINRTVKVANVDTVPFQNELHINNQHPSETSLDSATFDYTIQNDGSIEDLVEKVREILVKEKII